MRAKNSTEKRAGLRCSQPIKITKRQANGKNGSRYAAQFVVKIDFLIPDDIAVKKQFLC